jgi:lipid-binding SYLF domain-containing protein
MKIKAIGSLFVIGLLMPLLGCNPEPKSDTQRANLRDDSDVTLRRFEREDPSLREFLDKAVGYVVFPSVGKAGFGVGGAYGRGVVYDGSNTTGFATLTQASLGLQAGAQDFSEIVVFGTREAMNKFKDGKFEFGANASAVIIKAGAASNTSFREGVAVFTATKGGAMFELSLSGQKLRYAPTEGDIDKTETSTETRTETSR